MKDEASETFSVSITMIDQSFAKYSNISSFGEGDSFFWIVKDNNEQILFAINNILQVHVIPAEIDKAQEEEIIRMLGKRETLSPRQEFLRKIGYYDE